MIRFGTIFPARVSGARRKLSAGASEITTTSQAASSSTVNGKRSETSWFGMKSISTPVPLNRSMKGSSDMVMYPVS